MPSSIVELSPQIATRPLPKASYHWSWEPRPEATRWQWCRVYHQSTHAPDGATFRGYGPKARLDHHHPAVPPIVDPSGRRILYVGVDLATSACEVFGEVLGPDYNALHANHFHLDEAEWVMCR